MAKITCNALSKTFGNVVAVKNLDLEVQDNEFIVLLGPSGCGKTTTLNMIAGLEEISGGDLFFDERRVNQMPPHRRNVAMVFQSYALYPQKTVYENMAFGLRLKRMPRAEIDRRVRAVAVDLEVDHLLDRRPSQLSGGQRQRVALGRAIVRDPSVFVMDEPLSNLDATLRVSMRTLIKRLHQRMSATFVYVTHDQAEAMTLADRILVMNHGHKQQLGSPAEIYEHPANTFVASFLGSPQINLIEGVLARSGAQTVFRRDGTILPVPEWIRSDQRERPAIAGIRPEDIQIDDGRQPEADGASAVLETRIMLVSPLGSETYVNVDIAGHDVIVRVGKEFHPRPGDSVRLRIDSRRLQLFDKETSLSLRQPMGE